MSEPNFILVNADSFLSSTIGVFRHYEKDFYTSMPGSEFYRYDDTGLSNPILRLLNSISEQHLRDLDYNFSNLTDFGLNSKVNNLTFKLLDGYRFSISPTGPSDRDDLNYLIFLFRKFFENRQPLIKNFREKVRVDEFGVADKKRWVSQLNGFFEKVVFNDCLFLSDTSFEYLISAEKKLKKMDSSGRANRHRVTVTVEKEFFEFCHKFYFKLSERCAQIQFVKNQNADFSSSSAKGIAFEVECSKILTDRGWNVELTPTTGDQGADLIITRGPIKMVLQCKNFASPVGNDAVQQVFSAKQFFGASVGAVVSKSGYTNSASELANSTGVLLLSISDLSEL